jgi:hypothetical protein
LSDRETMRRLALAVVGLGAAPETSARYLELVGPNDVETMQTAMLSMSGCGLTVRGLWRRFGMQDPRLEAPYEPGSVMTTIQGMAQEAGAWTSGLGPLDVGDVVYVSNPDHVGTIVRAEPAADGGVDVTTVDGGSTDAAGRQLIVTWKRSFAADGSITGGPLAGNGRVVFGCVSLPAMAARFGAAGAGLGGLPTRLLGLGAVGLGGWLLWRHRRALGL